MKTLFGDARGSPGAAPSVELDEIASLPSGPERVWLTCIDYSPGEVLPASQLAVSRKNKRRESGP